MKCVLTLRIGSASRKQSHKYNYTICHNISADPPPSLLSATTTEYIMHMFRQQRPSDMSLKCRPPPPSSLICHMNMATWHGATCTHTHAYIKMQRQLYSRKSCHLKIYQLPVNQNFQYFQKSKFSDIKYCIFKNGLRLHSILHNKIKLYIRTFKA